MAFNAIISACFILLSTAITGSSAGSNVCNANSVGDIYFMLDSSGSISEKNFGKVKDFICNFAAEFNLGVNGVQIGFGQFSTYAQHIANLNAYTNLNALCKAVRAIRGIEGYTYTYLALDLIRNGGYLTDKSKGARTGIPRIAALFTDGQSQNPSKTITSALALRALGFEIFVFAVGGFNPVEIRAIAGKRENVLTVNSFDTLDLIKQRLIQRLCEVSISFTFGCVLPPGGIYTNTPPADPSVKDVPPVPVDTNNPTDYDTPAPPPPPTTTATTTPKPTTTTTTTTTPKPTTTTTTTTTPKPTTTTTTTTTPKPTTTTTTTTTPKPTTTTTTTTTPKPTTTTTTTTTPAPTAKPCPSQYELDLVFCVDGSGSIGADNFVKNWDFIRIILKAFNISPDWVNVGIFTFGSSTKEIVVPLSGDNATIFQKIENVYYQHSTTETSKCIDAATTLLIPGVRPNAAKLLIVVTDGQSTTPGNTHDSAVNSKAAGVIISTVGVGSEVNSTELTDVSSKPNLVFFAKDYESLPNLAPAIAQAVCDENKNKS